MIELIFIYNAKSGIGNAFIDWAHKIISPKTYDCNLCSITYNNLGKEIKWKEFLNNINAHSRFYYIDHLKELDFVDEKTELPCVFINEKDEFKLIINSHEMTAFDNVDQLISRLKVFLEKPLIY